MKVGDLVKVYHYSHTARKRLQDVAESRPTMRIGVDGYYVGLIIATSDNDPKHRKVRRVLRCVDGEWEDYHVNRLEVIA